MLLVTLVSPTVLVLNLGLLWPDSLQTAVINVVTAILLYSIVDITPRLKPFHGCLIASDGQFEPKFEPSRGRDLLKAGGVA